MLYRGLLYRLYTNIIRSLNLSPSLHWSIGQQEEVCSAQPPPSVELLGNICRISFSIRLLNAWVLLLIIDLKFDELLNASELTSPTKILFRLVDKSRPVIIEASQSN